MASKIGDLEVRIGADVKGLRRDLKKGEGELAGFGNRAVLMGRRVSKAAALITAGTAAAAAGTLALAKAGAEAGERIAQMSRVAGTTPEKFQRWSAAARTVNVEQEKLSDILKDMQDRVGDFMATGGGPMADFFENIAPRVGVTAEQFARLSGPEALQLYVSSLEKAGVTQNEMTFYLEAMSSDLVALLPLLRNNGAEMDRLGQKAADAGIIMSNETVAGAEELSNKFREMRDEIRGELISALISVEDELVLLAQFVTDYGVPALTKLVELAAGAAEKFKALSGWIQSFGGNPRFFDEQGNEYDQNNNLISSPNMTIGTPLTLEDDLLPPDGEGENLGTITLPPRRTGGRGGAGGRSSRGGGGRSGEEDFDRFQGQYATDIEKQLEKYERELEMLREFRSKKLATEEEFNELEQRMQEEHQEKMLDLENARRNATMSAISGAFGELSSLMQTENKKLFQIGKAAALADATISGYQAAVDAWQKGMKIGGPPLAAAFSGASLLRTGALISQIASQSYGGSGGGGGAPASAGAVGAADGAGGASSYYTVNLAGEGPISRSSVRDLMRMMNEEIEGGAVLNGIVVNG